MAAEDTPVVAFVGEFDLNNAPWFERELKGALGSNRSIVVDASDLTYLDSSVLITLIRINHTCRSRGGRLVIACPRPNINRVLQVTGLAAVIGVERDIEAALHAA